MSLRPRTHPRSRTRGPADAGHILVLLIGFTLLALLLITVVAAASSVYLGHKMLLSLADGAALAGADTFVLAGGSTTQAPTTLLDDASVTAAAQTFLAEGQESSSLGQVTLAAGTGAPDGHTAQVTLTAVVHPWLVSFLVPAGIPLTAVGTARAQLVQ